MNKALDKPRDAILGTEKIGRLLIKMSVPSTVGMLVYAMYNFVDTIFIGRGVGAKGIGGLIIAFPFQMLIISMAGVIAIGGSSMVSRNLGAGNREKAAHTAGNAFTMSIMLGVCTTVLGLVFLNPLLRLFGATEVLIGYSRDYLSIILYGSLFITFGMVSNSIVRSEGRAVVAMSLMLFGTVINLILDPIFIFGLDMGIKGAAWATIISQGISTSCILWLFVSGRSSLALQFRHLKIQKQIVKEMMNVGASSFARQAGGSIMLVAVNNMLGKHGGDLYISCFGIINRFFLVTFMTIHGLAQGLQPIVGYNYGAKQMDRVKEALKMAIYIATGFCCFMFLSLMIFPSYAVRIFSDDTELIRIGTVAIRYVIFAIPLIGFQVIAASFFQAIGKGIPALFLGMSRQFFLLIPFVLLLPSFFGANGVFLAFPFADALSFIITLFWIVPEIRRMR